MGSDLARFGKGIDLSIEALIPPEERRALILEAAGALLDDARAEMRAAGFRTPGHTMLVDGRPADRLDGIDPDKGTITYRFPVAGIPVDMVRDVLAMLVTHSPVLTGRYRGSHRVFADGEDVTGALGSLSPERAEAVDRWTIFPTVPYARKLEVTMGVYEGVAAVAGQRFANQAAIGFGFESPILPYVPGGASRAERQAIRGQPSRIAAMRTERATRVPVITIVALDR